MPPCVSTASNPAYLEMCKGSSASFEEKRLHPEKGTAERVTRDFMFKLSNKSKGMKNCTVKYKEDFLHEHT